MSEDQTRIYSIKQHGSSLEDCDSEPVQTPGCVQAHGVLLVLRPSDLVVLQASDNGHLLLGSSVEGLLGQPVARALGEDAARIIRRFVDHECLERTPVFARTFQPTAALRSVDMVLHTLDGQILVELEPAAPPDSAAPIDYYSFVRQTTVRLDACVTARDFCQVVADEVRRITSLDRVMVYRFHPDDTGEVFTEARREDMTPFLGLRYPPHDIPKPAREIFKKIWIRPLGDAAAELAEMVPLANPDTGRPLEMTYCALRGASVMYTEYLHNMGVAASLTLAIHRDGELWGLIAGHHETPTRFPYQMRAACEFLAQFVSLQLKQVEDNEQVQYRARMEANHYALLARAARLGGLSTMVEQIPTLLEGIEAGGVAVYHRDRWWTVGCTPTLPQLEELAVWLRTRSPLASEGRAAFATDRLAVDFPPAAAYADVATGLLAVPASRSNGNVILWFRPEVVQTVHWGGNPHELPTVVGPHGPRLTPRRSFEIWKEIVRGRAAPWKPVEIEAAQKLKLLVMDLVISRAEHLVELNEHLARSNDELNAFAYVASHDLMEPLRNITAYAQLLLEDARQGRANERQATERIEALLRLTNRMNSLLDAMLHFSQVGRTTLKVRVEDLGAVVAEAIEMLGTGIVDVGVQIRIPRPLPSLRCERVRVREVFANLISNAIKYNDRPDRSVEIGFIEPDEAPPVVFRAELRPASAAGHVVLYVRDNGIGIEARYYEQIFKIFRRLHGREAYRGGAGAGLAIVKKLVEHHGGVAWVDSTPGVGSTFYFTLAGSEQWS